MDQISNQASEQTGNQTSEQTGDQTSEQTGNQTSDQTSEQTGNQTSEQTGNQTSEQTGNQTSEQTENQTSEQTGDQTSEQTGNQTSEQTGDQTSEQNSTSQYLSNTAPEKKKKHKKSSKHSKSPHSDGTGDNDDVQSQMSTVTGLDDTTSTIEKKKKHKSSEKKESKKKSRDKSRNDKENNIDDAMSVISVSSKSHKHKKKHRHKTSNADSEVVQLNASPGETTVDEQNQTNQNDLETLNEFDTNKQNETKASIAENLVNIEPISCVQTNVNEEIIPQQELKVEELEKQEEQIGAQEEQIGAQEEQIGAQKEQIGAQKEQIGAQEEITNNEIQKEVELKENKEIEITREEDKNGVDQMNLIKTQTANQKNDPLGKNSQTKSDIGTASNILEKTDEKREKAVSNAGNNLSASQHEPKSTVTTDLLLQKQKERLMTGVSKILATSSTASHLLAAQRSKILPKRELIPLRELASFEKAPLPEQRPLNPIDMILNNPFCPSSADALFKDFCQKVKKLIENSDYPSELVHMNDWILLRFFWGCNFLVEPALRRFDMHLRYRESHCITTKMKEYVREKMLKPLMPENAPFHSKVVNHYPLNILLRDVKGGKICILSDFELNPVMLLRPGHFDHDRLFKELTPHQFGFWFAHQMEFILMLLNELSRERCIITQITIIIDFSGFSKITPHERAMQLLATTLIEQFENYPETVSSILLFRHHGIFPLLWKMVKDKIACHASKFKLLEDVPGKRIDDFICKKNLPKILGGSCTSQYCMTMASGLLNTDPFGLGIGKKDLVIRPDLDRFFIVEVKEKVPISWKWALTVGVDITFSLIYLAAEPKLEEILEPPNRHGNIRIVSGSFKPPHTGKLKFLWSHTRSQNARKVVSIKIN